jgi:menaquinone-dependent protoporphyrinogen oxidase
MKILVAHASGFGATTEVAKEIAKILGEAHQVELLPVARVRSLEGYDAVVVGSSLRAGRWLGGLTRFVARFHRELPEKPLALFAVALTARTLEGSRRVLAESLPRLLGRYPQIRPVTTQAFGGVIDYERYNLAVRAIMRKAARDEGLPTSGFVDFRDWEAIRTWARDLSAQFSEMPATTPPSPS